MRGEQLLEFARGGRQAVLRFEVAVVERQQVGAQVEFGDLGAGAARRRNGCGEQTAIAGFPAGAPAEGKQTNRHGGLRKFKVAILHRLAARRRGMAPAVPGPAHCKNRPFQAVNRGSASRRAV